VVSRVGTAVATGAGVAVAVAAGFAVGVALGVGFDEDFIEGCGVRTAVAVAVGVAAGFRVAAAFAVGEGGGAACATVAIGVGVCITTSGFWLCAGAGTCRAANAESSAPIPKPAMITPAKSGTIGKPPPRSSSSFEERRRRGERDPELMSPQRSTREGLALDGRAHAKAKR
jgi:hypothetical protein